MPEAHPHVCAQGRADPRAAGPSVQLPSPWAALTVTAFPLEEHFPPVLWTCCTDSLGPGLGKLFMWAAANELRKHGIKSFSKCQVEASENWETKFYGKLPECKVGTQSIGVLSSETHNVDKQGFARARCISVYTKLSNKWYECARCRKYRHSITTP